MRGERFSDYLEFFKNVRVGPGCWEWVGPRASHGGGRFHRASMLAHRWSAQQLAGQWVIGKHVLRTCTNEFCVNPGHIVPQDAAPRPRRGLASQLIGSRHGRAKLTEVQVIAARERYDAGGTTVRELARELGVDPSTARPMLKRKTWRHV